ncbi:MAG: type II secretion system protein [Patescibacteria group bacterium]|nr:type II secretion system protein [bacterium]MDZ4240902.1 type II secretion system protein [Patescibacteria group bacterium]
MTKFSQTNKGYTLVETLVSLGIFMIVAFIAITALFLITDAHRRAQATRAIVDNLDFSIEEIVRSARDGRLYNCGSESDLTAQIAAGNNGIGTFRNCLDGTYIAFEPPTGDVLSPSDQVIYRLNGNAVHKSVDGGTSFITLTDPAVTINDLKFYISGADPRDGIQSKVLMILRAETRIKGEEKAVFNIQTTITQRFTDL